MNFLQLTTKNLILKDKKKFGRKERFTHMKMSKIVFSVNIKPLHPVNDNLNLINSTFMVVNFKS